MWKLQIQVRCYVLSHYESFYNPDSNCIFNSLSDQTFTSSTVETEDKTSSDKIEMEDTECEYTNHNRIYNQPPHHALCVAFAVLSILLQIV